MRPGSQSQYPWRTRLGWSCKGFMYFVDVCEAECLDVARGLWLTGADYLTLYFRQGDGPSEPLRWTFFEQPARETQRGGYSVR